MVAARYRLPLTLLCLFELGALAGGLARLLRWSPSVALGCSLLVALAGAGIGLCQVWRPYSLEAGGLAIAQARRDDGGGRGKYAAARRLLVALLGPLAYFPRRRQEQVSAAGAALLYWGPFGFFIVTLFVH